ncbi:hypothetical protein ACOSQ3_020145 [Xanthoceras sorbifolium]
MYKQKLERRCSDLQKAEAEVDLLGDEVDALLSLLKKIYTALDHYSPILQHYPGNCTINYILLYGMLQRKKGREPNNATRLAEQVGELGQGGTQSPWIPQ